MTIVNHPFQAVSVLGSTLAAVFPRVLNVGFRSIPGKPSRSSPKHAISGRKSDSLKGMLSSTQAGRRHRCLLTSKVKNRDGLESAAVYSAERGCGPRAIWGAQVQCECGRSAPRRQASPVQFQRIRQIVAKPALGSVARFAWQDLNAVPEMVRISARLSNTTRATI
jgi:hypothetical protein